MKRFVWPALKTLIAVIVAIALVKIAFFPSQNDSATADISPGYSANVNTVTVTTGNISNTVEVKGRIVQDATVEVQADLAGVVDSVAVEKDTQVSAGDPLLYIKHSESQPPVTKTDESGNVTQTPTEDKVTWSTIYAPVSGTVTPKVIKQQETGVGVVVATITPEELTRLAVGAFTRPTDPGVQTVHLHERVPVGEQLSLIAGRLRSHGTLTFAQIIEDAERTAVVVARFLALLILHRQGSAELDQPEAMGEITVTWCGGQDDLTGMMTSKNLTELEEEFA